MQLGNPVDFPGAIRYLQQRGGVVLEHFKAPSNLTGWIVENGGDRHVFYTTTDGDLIAGELYSATGENLSALDFARAQPGQPMGAQERAWKLAESSATAFRESPQHAVKRVVYVLFDFGCPYCKRVWEEATNYSAQGNVEIRWVPVSALTHNPRAAQLFFAAKTRADAQAAFTGITNRFAPADPAVEEKLKLNKQVMQQIGAQGVPVILFKDAGGVPRALVGAPDASVLANLFGGR
jgi:thiol:disulfide interchange protein DsbG